MREKVAMASAGKSVEELSDLIRREGQAVTGALWASVVIVKHTAVSITLGLVLFVLTFIVLAFSRLLLAQLAKGEGRQT